LSARVAGVAEDAPGEVIALVAVEVAGAVSVVFDWLPTLGGSVASGAGAAPSVGSASMDAQPPSSSLMTRGGGGRMVVVAGSGPGVVWLIFLFFFFFFFFFSSFFSSASLKRKGG
jgi:hypothetical protein